MKKLNMNAIDLFCGAGGGSLGLIDAGINVIGGVDADPISCEVYEKNLKVKSWCKDLREVSYSQILDHFNVENNDINILMGCPPCQNFSSLRNTRPWPDGEPKDELLMTFLRHIRDGRPPIVIFENVPGILTADEGKYLKYFIKQIKKLGYGVAWKKINAADFGVPQIRERVITFGVMGARDEDIKFPEGTHKKMKNKSIKNCWKTTMDAIGDLPKLKSGESSSIPNHEARTHEPETIKRFKKIPKDGGGRKDLPKDLWLKCHLNLKGADSVYGRMWWNKPAPTMTTRCTTPSSGRFIHPEQNRGITVREAARIQSFPDKFIFPEVIGSASRLVGNAVPPRLISTITRKFFQINKSLVC